MSDPFSNQRPGGFPAPGQPSFSPPPPPSQYGVPNAPLYTGSGGIPPDYSGGSPLPIVSNEPPSRRSRGKMLGAVAGVVAVLAAGTFAFTQLRSNESSGGAASPMEVGEQFVTALDNEDMLGLIDLLLPGERETFRQPMLDLVEELQRLEITDDNADLNKVAGVDIQIVGPEVDVDDTNVDDIATVSIVANASVTVDGRELPIGDFLIDTVFDGERPEVDEDSGEQDFNVSFASVKDGDRWYVSMFYTAASAAFGGEDVPEEGVTAVGADSPEDALDNLIKYTSNLDLENIIASLNPNEASALQRYAPLFVDDAQDELDDVDMTWSISDTQYSVTGSGDTRQVGIDGFHVEAQVEGETVEFDWQDGCLIGTTPSGDFDSCKALDDADSAIDDYLGSAGISDAEPLKQLLEDAGDTFSDFSLHGVVVDKVDGSWYVSPIGTGFETFLSVLRALDRDEIETIINDVQDVLDATFDDFDMSEIDLPSATTVPTDDPATADTAIDEPSTADTATIDTGFQAFESWYDCLELPTEDEVLGCVQDGVAAGTFEADFIPAPYLFADCGLYDYYVSGEIFTDDAATFLATIEPGSQCIVDAAAAAGIDLLYSSPEFLYPECYVMDNPYNFDEPGEADGFACALDEAG